jgi:hypothetical protein
MWFSLQLAYLLIISRSDPEDRRLHHLSISRCWEETRGLLSRDAGLFAAVGLAMFVLPFTIAGLFVPAVRQGEVPPPGPWMIVALLALVVAAAGQLTVSRLALAPPTSVGQALRRGSARTPAYLGAFLLYVIPLVFLTGLMASLIGPSGEPQAAPTLLAMVVLLFVFLPLIVRLMLMVPVAAAEEAGPIAILRRSFALTRGHTLRLIGFLLLTMFAALLALLAVEAVLGALFLLLFGQPEPMSIGMLAMLLLSNALQAAVIVLFLVLLARIYAQLSGPEGVTVPRSGI